MQIIYNGADISSLVRTEKCVHEMFLRDRADTLRVVFGDLERWSGWGPAVGDTIRMKEGNDDTGGMRVTAVTAETDVVVIDACSLPKSFTKRSRAWSDVGLLQIVEQIASEHGLKTESSGIGDFKYSYVRQDNEEDFTFLNRRLGYEGCAFLVYDGVLTAYSFDYLEDMDPGLTLLDASTDSIRIYDREYAGGMKVTNGSVTGEYSEGDSKANSVVFVNAAMDSIGIADRFAEGLCKKENWERKTAVLYSDSLLDGLFAGSKLTLQCEFWGKVSAMATRVRHDFGERQSKIWFRRCRNG